MTWNPNINDAPRDVTIWAASKCGKVIMSAYSEKRSAWQGFAAKETPIAWAHFDRPAWPAHLAVAA